MGIWPVVAGEPWWTASFLLIRPLLPVGVPEPTPHSLCNPQWFWDFYLPMVSQWTLVVTLQYGAITIWSFQIHVILGNGSSRIYNGILTIVTIMWGEVLSHSNILPWQISVWLKWYLMWYLCAWVNFSHFFLLATVAKFSVWTGCVNWLNLSSHAIVGNEFILKINVLRLVA